MQALFLNFFIFFFFILITKIKATLFSFFEFFHSFFHQLSFYNHSHVFLCYFKRFFPTQYFTMLK